MKDHIGILLMRWRIHVVLNALKGDVLDVGCGTNELMKAYKARHPECKALGVDVHPWEGVDAVIKTSASLPFGDGAFDRVCCIAALNHIPEREAFLCEARRVLRPNGHLILTMLPAGISRVWHFVRSPWDADQHERGMEEGEVYGFTYNEMVALLRQTGFALMHSSSFMLGVNRLYIAKQD